MKTKRYQITRILVLLSFLFIISCADDSRVKDLDSFMTYCSNNGLFNGTISVAENNNVIYKKAFGLSDKRKQEKLTTEHAFYLASVSKQFTTMAIMILKEQNKLNYNETLLDYFPEFPSYAAKVTIKHLMTHTSGIPDHFRLGAYKPKLTNNDVLKLLIEQDTLDFEPGEKYSYSNGAYVMLAMIVEKSSGFPFNEFMKNNIFDPIGMENSLVYDDSEPEITKRAIGYNIFGEEDDYDLFTTGAGGLYSTIEDLAKWNKALSENKLVKKESLNEAFTSFKLNNDSLTNYGYGWAVRSDQNGKVVSHTGGLAGFRTYIERNLKNKHSFFYLSSFGNAIPINQINEGVRNILDNKDYVLPKIPISIKMHELIENVGITKAVEEYNNIKNLNEQKYNFDEEELNNLGYYFIEKEKLLEAIELFKLNIISYPDSFNPYDSMGEVYMLNKEYDLAIDNYKKSLELNSKNKNAVDMIKKIDEIMKNL